MAEPILVLSTSNWTPVTPTLPEAVAVRVTLDPETVAPLLGAVRLTASVSVAEVVGGRGREAGERDGVRRDEYGG